MRVLINGANGKMGKAMSAGIMAESDMQIVAAVDLKSVETDFGLLCGDKEIGLKIETDLKKAIKRTNPDVMLEFTNPQAVMKSVRIAVKEKVSCVIGTSGLTPNELEKLAALTKENQTPVFVAPNFALGAVLMMRFAKEAARYFPNVEIIERHHDQKLDAPSGTAAATLEMIAEAREVFNQGASNEFEKITCSRGGNYQGMRVHSVRLPGYVANQEILFGDIGQILTIKHESVSRDSFIPGVLLAIRKVDSLNGLVIGLENIM